MSMAQSPTISIPRKKTDDVDWATPIRQMIATSYGESPDNYASECSSLQRCRQDAVKGAGSDATARDLLYKYFGQLELLELRFTDIRVIFPWHDAFTAKLTTQTSLAFEKASVIFQIASTHSSLANSQNRSDPEGLKRSFHYFKTSAGMLTYINDNFLHAPSTDLSKEVIKLLTGIMIAQATEVFFEKLVDEKKSATLISKVAAQAAYLYTSLVEEFKEFAGRGIFDRCWVQILQIKSKYFHALAMYHRSQVDTSAGSHGDSLSRLTHAESLAKESLRLAQSLPSMFISSLTPTLPPDAGVAMLDLATSVSTLLTDKLNDAKRENDLIYNAVIPPVTTLPAIDKLSVAEPIPIQEVYGNPDVQKVIGPDIFAKLIPLSVHESASVYSEEKAKLVRGEAERAEMADEEARVKLESLGLPSGLAKWRAIGRNADEGGAEDESVPAEVERWAEEVERGDGVRSIERLFAELDVIKRKVDQELSEIGRELDAESRECEAMRVKYDHLWTQDPASGLTRGMRQDLKSHRDALTAASSSDAQVVQLWDSVHPDLILLLSGSDALQGYFAAEANSSGKPAPGMSLLDVEDVGGDMEREQAVVKEVQRRVVEIEERIGRVNKIKRERGEVLKDLKEKIQTDDVSHLLLLNRRSPNVEPGLFQAELAKFRPYQARLAQTSQAQTQNLDEISQLYKQLASNPKLREWVKRADVKDRRMGDAIARLSRARDGWRETRDTLGKGLAFYRDLGELVGQLRRSAASYVKTREEERRSIVAKAEASKGRGSSRTAGPPPSLPPKGPGSTTGLEGQFASMGFGGGGQAPRVPPPPPGAPSSPWSLPPSQPSFPSLPSVPQSPIGNASSYASYNSYAPPPQQQQPIPPPPQPTRMNSLPPPPPPPQHYGGASSPPPPPPASDPYARLFDTPGLSSAFSAQPPPPRQSYQNTSPPPLPQQYGGLPPPPPHVGYGGYGAASPPPPQQQQSPYGYPQQQPMSPSYPPQHQGSLPPPPAPPQQQQWQSWSTPQYGGPPANQPYGGYGK